MENLPLTTKDAELAHSLAVSQGMYGTPPFVKVMNPGTLEGRVFVKAEWDGKRLSITGVDGPMHNGDARGGCGQISLKDALPVKPWTAEMIARLAEIWHRWHLNDMRAGCEHQRAEFDAGRMLELQELTWGDAYNKARGRAVSGEMTPGEYREHQRRTVIVERLTIAMDRPKHPDLWGEDGEEMLRADMVKLGKREVRAAGWVSYREHPEGLLSRTCPTCGYRYGTAWLHEDVPPEVLEEIKAFPDARITPAWI